MHNWFAIILSLIIGIMLAVLPMPDWTMWARPAWVLMILIYWAISVPARVSVGIAWLTGLVFDLITGTLLGEHALALTIVIYFVSRIHLRLSLYPLLQQGLMILGFVGLYQFILYCIQGFIGELPQSHLYWLPSVSSMLLWPWLFVLMRDFQKWFKVKLY